MGSTSEVGNSLGVGLGWGSGWGVEANILLGVSLEVDFLFWSDFGS
jgi:hypothetical protein